MRLHSYGSPPGGENTHTFKYGKVTKKVQKNAKKFLAFQKIFFGLP